MRWHAIGDGRPGDRVVRVDVRLSTTDPRSADADLIAVAAGPLATELGAPARASEDADPVAIVYTDGPPLAVIAVGPGIEGLRTAAARAVRDCPVGSGETVAWALDRSSPIAIADQVRALAEGAVLGGYDGRRWRGAGAPRDRVRRFVICGVDRDRDGDAAGPGSSGDAAGSGSGSGPGPGRVALRDRRPNSSSAVPITSSSPASRIASGRSLHTPPGWVAASGGVVAACSTTRCGVARGPGRAG
jgi:hypothetical protein